MIGLALFVYKRPEHTMRVLESIKNNGFKKIYIFQDGLRSEKDRSDWDRVTDIIKNIDFADVELHISDKNKGLANSIIDGMNYVFKWHETAIALEDDMLLLDGYKKYMEVCFEAYAKNPKIFSISGGATGMVVPDDYNYDTFLTYRVTTAGLGTWKDRWKGFRRDPKIYESIMADPKKVRRLRLSGDDVEGTFQATMDGRADSWAVFWQMYVINNLGYHVNPSYDYTKDIGRDGTGTNTRQYTDRYQEYRFAFPKDEYNLIKDMVVDKRIIRDILAVFSSGEKRENVTRLRREFLWRYVPALICGGKIKKYIAKHNISEIYFAGGSRLDYFSLRKLSKYVKIKGVVSDDLEIKGFPKITIDDAARGKYTIVTLRKYYYEYGLHVINKFKSSAKIIYLKEML